MISKNNQGLRYFWKFLTKNGIKPYKFEQNIGKCLNNDIFYNNNYMGKEARKQIRNSGFTYSAFLRGKWYNKIFGGHFPKIPIFLNNTTETESFYHSVYGRNCENVIGYVPIPVGLIGPLNINNKSFHVPIATTEGGLVASINRGSKIMNSSIYHYQFEKKYNIDNTRKILSEAQKTISVIVFDKGMTRAPLVEFPSIHKIPHFIRWVDSNFLILQEIFNSTTKYGFLKEIICYPEGKKVHIKIRAYTGEAMGMNMVSRGAEEIIKYLLMIFPDIKVISLSGNVCTDKKTSALNISTGRGKMAIANTIISREILQKLTQTQPETLVKLNKDKNLLGSALVGSLGGQNAHVANIIAGIFAATGQDLGHVGSSSNCFSDYELSKEGDLEISLTFPCLELGIIGGGTQLPAQSDYLKIMDIHNEKGKIFDIKPVEKLATVVAGTCLAGELSLMISLAKGDLMKAHMSLNRKP